MWILNTLHGVNSWWSMSHLWIYMRVLPSWSCVVISQLCWHNSIPCLTDKGDTVSPGLIAIRVSDWRLEDHFTPLNLPTLSPKISYLSCLFSCAALNNSWMFLVISSVLLMTSSVHGRDESHSPSDEVSDCGTVPSPSQPLALEKLLCIDLWVKWTGSVSKKKKKETFEYVF